MNPRELRWHEQKFVDRALTKAQECEMLAREIRATLDRIYNPPPGTRVEINGDTVRFVTEVPVGAA